MTQTRNWTETKEESLARELAQLKDAVREMSDNPELLRTVGPSDEEQEAAERRIKELDRIDTMCAWDKFDHSLTGAQRNARKRWAEIMDVQGEFERRYC